MEQQTVTKTKPGDVPTRDEIAAARAAFGHTQAQAAQLIYKSVRVWQKWESGDHRMEAAFWELYMLKSGAWQGVRAL